MKPAFRALALAAFAALVLLPTPVFAHPDDEEGESPPRALGPASGGNAPAVAQDGTWKVDAPPGKLRDVPLDVTTGTWMSVDVSPDGREIVFDLMGDLYLLPIGGGEAKALTSGLAWDEQPRFSPDGKRIAFTSDRGGGDNLWVMERDGARPRAVTKETFRLLNSPAWTPDGQYLAARKHFTSTRSAGAGEIWLYHWTGGEGVQMTKRRTEQKDEGEPAFSPDGRWLYWSMDVTPGTRFEYNKNSNTGLYAIQRLDRASGEVTTFAGGPGGAIRPTPSPDGRSVAFIRRVRGESVLFLADVAGGEERPLYAPMERDLQESWAVHGVYPGMAWTPDSRSLVFWAKGRIRRVDVATGAAREIPFRVKDTRALAETIRFPVAVAPESLHTRMLRWVTVAPAGDRVAFSALGRIWVRDLPNGRPRRLTRQADHWEFYPAWSRDGRSIVFVTWDDERLGSVRIANVATGAERVVTREPGRYLEPALSPDGRTVVYRVAGGGGLFAPTGTRDRGVFRVAAAGGVPKKVRASGYQPHFGAANDRVYLVDVAGEDQDSRTLVSVDLDGAGEHTHLKGVYLTEARLSPDEKWIAFREKYRLWVAPFTRAGRPYEIGPSMRDLPVRLLSRDAGDWIGWSGDSRSLSWSLGPQLHTRELRDVFAFAPGAPDSFADRPARVRDIGFGYAHDRPAGSIALTGATVITMRDRSEVLRDATVVVTGNRIAAVGPRGTVKIPAGARVFDVAGRTIVPGFVDTHWHGSMGDDQILPEASWVNYASLAFGVTTLHDPSNDSGEIFTQGELQRAGLIVAPRIFSTGTILYGAKGDFRADVDSLGDALMHLRRMQAYGATSVKSYNQPRRDQRQQVLEAARRLGVNVYPEGGALYPHNMTMVIDGHTSLEHSLPIERVYDDVVQLWGQAGTGYVPTFNVAYGGLDGEHYWYAKTDVWANEQLQRFVPRRVLDARARRPERAPDNEWNHIAVAEEAAKLHRAGVPVLVGAHGQREGLGTHWDIWSMVQGGMTPHEALWCATKGGADHLGYGAEIGSIEPGKLADLVVLDRDPLANIRDSESVRWVMANGRLYDGPTMNELAPRAKARPAFWWETQQKAEKAVLGGRR